MNNIPAQHRVNQIGRIMDVKTLEFLGRVDIDYGHDTSWGTQNITTDGGNFWVEFYSKMPARFQGERPAFACGKNFRRGEEPAYRIGFFRCLNGGASGCGFRWCL